MPATFGNGVPNRGTSEQELDQWNIAMRASPIYQSFMARMGLPGDGRVRLSRDQQEALENELRRNGIVVPSGMHIDQGGNLNQKNRTARNVAIAAGIAAGGVGAAGALGAFGAAGAAGAGGAGAAGAGAAGAGLGTTAAGLAGLSGAGAAGAGTAAGLGSIGAGMAGLGAAGGAAGAGAGAAGLGSVGAGLAGMGGGGAAGAGAAGGGAGIGALAGPSATAAGGGGSMLSSLVSNPRTYETAGRLLSGAAGGAADERAGRNDAASRQHQTSQNALVNLLGLDERATMDRAQMGLTAPGQRTRQAILGAILQNLQPVNVQAPAGIRMGSISGGLSPSLLTPQARQAGGELTRQALDALLNRSDVPAAPNYAQRGMLPAPTYQGAGRGESLLSLLGMGLNAYGATRGGR